MLLTSQFLRKKEAEIIAAFKTPKIVHGKTNLYCWLFGTRNLEMPHLKPL